MKSYVLDLKFQAIFVVSGTVLAVLVSIPSRCMASEPANASRESIQQRIVRIIESALRQRQTLVGAQLAMGTSDRLILSRQFGVIKPGSNQPVDRETLFCIGSCSKPFASACVMRLVDEGRLSLDDASDKWVPEMRNLRLGDGRTVDKAPTVRQLLSHRGGIYTQRQDLSPIQIRAIRDFKLTMEESIAIIARQSLIDSPGESFHYSGAGYMLLGRVAELASGQSMEQILQTRICKPLELSRTTYFPSALDDNIANGGELQDGRIVANSMAPHKVGDKLRLPLVGGSIYSTAEETAEFARLMLNRGKRGDDQVLSEQAWSELTRRHADGEPYGLGWLLSQIRDGRIALITHNGALYSHRSMLYVNLAMNHFAVIHWTLSDPSSPGPRAELTQALLQLAE